MNDSIPYENTTVQYDSIENVRVLIEKFEKVLLDGSSCQMFKKLNTAFEWIMINKYNTSGLSHLTHNFFFIGPPNSDK